jgi:alcohol dehydrogenase class IV
MRPFVLDQPATRVLFGSGTLGNVAAELNRMHAERVLLIASTSAKAEADRIVTDVGDRVVARIDETQPHVPAAGVDLARGMAESNRADSVVTIGGGSTTGLGKAVVVTRQVGFMAIPTTYSGSEMTPIYGITEGEVKRTGRDPRVKPATVIYDVDLTVRLPPGVTAGSTMNALAHCVEALYAEERNPIVSLLAVEGIGALQSGSTTVSLDPVDVNGRAKLLYGAFLAGFALGSVGMAVHHRICHVLGGTFGLAHGDANAVILPYVVAYNQTVERLVMDELAAALGGGDPWALVRDLGRRLGAPTSLSQLGMREADLEQAAEMVVAAGGYNPRPIEPGWIRRLLGDAYEGRDPTGQ